MAELLTTIPVKSDHFRSIRLMHEKMGKTHKSSISSVTVKGTGEMLLRILMRSLPRSRNEKKQTRSKVPQMGGWLRSSQILWIR